MRRIGITSEVEVFREQERIINFIQSGYVNYFHIRKPSFSEQQMREYLAVFPNEVRQKLSLHDFHSLAFEMGIGGIHINKRNPILKEEYNEKRVSVSCHSIEQVKEWKERASYVFLSPIFDSISKKGYKSAFSFNKLKKYFNDKILDNKVVALGGVTKDNIKELENIGFSSCALLSDLWQLPKIMFITPNKTKEEIIKECNIVLQEGIKFIQLRMKKTSNDEILEVAKQIRPVCDKYCAILTVDDKIELLKSNLFDGVHLGKNDMPIKQAKQITQNKYLLGATCNTIQDVQKAIENGADYLGIGPYKYTTTKQNLAPILGLEGYQDIIKNMRDKNLNIPFYAIGGITLEDLQPLKEIGIFGIALSGAISTATNKQSIIKEILKTL